MKEDKINQQTFDSLKLFDNSLELLSYPYEQKETDDADDTDEEVEEVEEMSLESENDMEDFDDMEPRDEDNDFLIYKKNLVNDPEHVLRYCFDHRTVPLDYSKYGKIDKDQVEDCIYCGSKKFFECQINNNLLNYVDELGDLDWGIVVLYSCSKSCFKDNIDYYEETIKIQKEVYSQVEEKPEKKPKKKNKPKKKQKQKVKKQEEQFDPSSWA